MCWLFVCFFYRRFYDKDGDIGNLYYKVVSRIRRRNRKVQTPISPLIIFSITLLRTFCNSLYFFSCIFFHLFGTAILTLHAPNPKVPVPLRINIKTTCTLSTDITFHFLFLRYGHQAGTFCKRVKINDIPISFPVFSQTPIGLCSQVLHTLIYHSSLINHHIITPIIHSAKMIPILSNIMLI